MRQSKCKHCNQSFDISDKPKGFMANHSRWCDKNPKRNSYKTNPASVAAMNAAKLKSGITNQFTKAAVTGCEIPTSKLKGTVIEGRPHSDETKRKISESRTRYLSENPDKHPWKTNNKFTSKPCEHLKKTLRNVGYVFEEEFKVLPNRHFSVDIAFVDKKIGIEINGNQHYDASGNLLPYYQNRHDLIVDTGWTLHEVHYSKSYDIVYISNLINGGP